MCLPDSSSGVRAPSARPLRCGVLLLIGALSLLAQPPLSLEQARARRSGDLGPARDGETATVQGLVTSRPVLFGDYAHLPLRDSSGAALFIEAPDFMFERVSPGDFLEVNGRITQRLGVPVLQPVQLRTLRQEQAPAPLPRRVQQLQTHAAIGLTVLVAGRVVALGEDAAGDYLLLDDGQPVPYPVYLPKAAIRLGPGLSRYYVGDRVRIVGTASQAATEPPYQNKFRLLITDSGAITLEERETTISPQMLLAIVVSLALLIGRIIHSRYRRMEIRRAVRRIHGFCEELLTAATHTDLTRKLRTIGPRALDVSNLEFHRFDRADQVLRRTVNPEGSEPIPTAAGKQQERSDNAIALCFRNRTPLHIADTRRSPLYWGANRDSLPRSVVLLPAFAREELSGVVQLACYDRPRPYHPEELTALQHLANQIAIVHKLQERQARKEQMMRSERLAATGQIISGVTGELKEPLETILTLAHRLLESRGEPQARSIVNEALRVSAILSRYSQAAGRDEEEPVPLEMNGLMERVVSLCKKDIAAFLLNLNVVYATQPLWVVGSAAQLENVLRNLLILASRTAKTSLDSSLRVETTLRQRSVIVTVRYGSILFDELPQTTGADGEGLGFSVCRGILHGFGGDVQLQRAGENACCMEIELPAAYPAESGSGEAPRQSSRVLTAMVLEPDPAEQRRLLSFWSSRGHRAIPIHNEAEAQELLRRLRMDVIFCAVRIGASNWVDIFDAVRGTAPAFVLLADGIEADASELFPQADGFVLRKPIEAGDLDRLLERIEQRMEAVQTA